MKGIANAITGPRYGQWLSETIVTLNRTHYTRDKLNDIGVGLHTKAAHRLADAVEEHGLTLGKIFDMGFHGLRRLNGVGETTCVVAAYILIEHGFDAMAWIGEKGRSLKGAMANVKAKSKRIPGRNLRKG